MSTNSPYQQRSDALKVTVSICLCYTLCFFLIGAYLRLKSRSYKWDDTVSIVSTVLSLGQFTTQYLSLAHGQGRSTEFLNSSPDLHVLNSVNRAGVILFFLTLYTSKGAGVALLYRFTLLRRHKITVCIAFGSILLLGIVSILLLDVKCGLTGTLYWHISRDSSQCQKQYLRWQITTGFDIASEILILFVPVDMIWSLRMKPSTKLSVLSRFWVRLPVLALAVGRFLYVRELLSTNDVGIASNQAIILQEIQMAASLSAPIIITLRPFAKDFNTSFGQGGETFAVYGISKANGNSGAMKSARSQRLSAKVAGRLGLTNKGSGGISNPASRNDRTETFGMGNEMDLEDMTRTNASLSRDTSESARGLTKDVITQTSEFEVVYEERRGEPWREEERSVGSPNES